VSAPGAFDAYVIDEQEKREQQAELARLTDKLNAYCDLHGLPHESADELAMRDDIGSEQRTWLMGFIDEWDAVA
jgi:hypothetical protein